MRELNNGPGKGASNGPQDFDPVRSIREGCCADWPKPCPYHEGWIDSYHHAQEAFDLAIKQRNAARAEVERLRRTMHGASERGRRHVVNELNNGPGKGALSEVTPATPCANCGHPFGRHWPEWMPRTRCEQCDCQGFVRG